MSKHNVKIPFMGVLLLLWLTSLRAQAPDTLWTKIYGAAKAKGYSVQQTADGGYVIAGTVSYDSYDYEYDVWLLKTDSLGDTLWTKTYGGDGRDCAWWVELTPDHGYLLAGFTASFGAGAYDYYLIRTDSLGDTLWTRTYGGIYDDLCFSVEQTFDNGYIMTGRSGGYNSEGFDWHIVKTDSEGNILWTKTYGAEYRDVCGVVRQTSDHGYIFAGGTESDSNGFDCWLAKTDSLGDTLWTRTYGDTRFEFCHSVQQTFDGGYILAGVISGDPWLGDFYLIRTDSNGDTIWTRHFGDTKQQEAYSVIQIQDSSFIVAGSNYISPGDSLSPLADVWLLKVDETGDTLWTLRVGGAYREEWAESVQKTSDGGYIIVGTRGNYVYLIKTTPEPSGLTGSGEGFTIHPCIAKLEIYPNPFRKLTTISFSKVQGAKGIELKIYDATGRIVKDLSCSMPNALCPMQISWDGTDQANRALPSGVYFLRFQSGDYTETEKLLFIE